jgi:hypothetical protein
MWSRSVEIRDVATQDTMQLLFMKDQDVVQTLSPNAQEKAFTDGIGAFGVIGCFQYLDATGDCYSSETGPEFAIMIANKILRRLSRGESPPAVAVRSKRREESASPRHG